MRIEGLSGEVHIVLSVEESRKLIVDHGERELVMPELEDPMECLFDISAARLQAEQVEEED